MKVTAYLNYRGELCVGLRSANTAPYSRIINRAEATAMRDALTEALAMQDRKVCSQCHDRQPEGCHYCKDYDEATS